jgi:hypothetical protein
MATAGVQIDCWFPLTYGIFKGWQAFFFLLSQEILQIRVLLSFQLRSENISKVLHQAPSNCYLWLFRTASKSKTITWMQNNVSKWGAMFIFIGGFRLHGVLLVMTR